MGDTIAKGINISLVDINKSQYAFSPDEKNNTILFGLKALGGVNAEIIQQIQQGRPYTSLKDFMQRTPIKKTAMISLIKGGAFDILCKDYAEQTGVHPRIWAMTYYLSIVSEPKTKLNLQNFNGLMTRELLPESLDLEQRTYKFNKALKEHRSYGDYFQLDEPFYKFYKLVGSDDSLSIINGVPHILKKDWKKIYDKVMDEARVYIAANQVELLKEFNRGFFMEMWNKYAQGSLSAWEMSSLCFYHSEHELAHVNRERYGIEDFQDLPEHPIIERTFKKGNKEIPIFYTHKIVGTVIGKNDTKSTISLLTTRGVISVKMTREYYAMFARQLSEKQEDGKKKIIEKGWFNRGTKVMLTGVREGDVFRTKTYKHTPTHQIYKILNIDKEGNLELEDERPM